MCPAGTSAVHKFDPQPSDILKAFPPALHFHKAKLGNYYVTPLWMVHNLQNGGQAVHGAVDAQVAFYCGICLLAFER